MNQPTIQSTIADLFEALDPVEQIETLGLLKALVQRDNAAAADDAASNARALNGMFSASTGHKGALHG